MSLESTLTLAPWTLMILMTPMTSKALMAWRWIRVQPHVLSIPAAPPSPCPRGGLFLGSIARADPNKVF